MALGRGPIDRLRDRKSTRLNSSHTEIYTLSLHDALPISGGDVQCRKDEASTVAGTGLGTTIDGLGTRADRSSPRSEEHTSELQSHRDLHSFPTRRSSDLRR